jgi:hypothetical protein
VASNEEIYEKLADFFEEHDLRLVSTPNPEGVEGSRVELVYPDGAHHALCGWTYGYWPAHLEAPREAP